MGDTVTISTGRGKRMPRVASVPGAQMEVSTRWGERGSGGWKIGSKVSVDILGKNGNITSRMKVENQKSNSLVDVGQKLVSHSKSAEFTANRGLVVELFPFIFEASERMSARAISRFLLEEQRVKLSSVTITKALGEPKKSWVSFFQTIQPEAITVAEWFEPRGFDYLFWSKPRYEDCMSGEKEGAITGALVRGASALLLPRRVAADKFLRKKWFSIGMGIRLKAKTYLEEHLMGLEDKL